jgi:hypothetical protein
MALFFGAVTVLSVIVARNNNYVYLPIGGLLFTSVAATLGVRSWLISQRRKHLEKESGKHDTASGR